MTKYRKHRMFSHVLKRIGTFNSVHTSSSLTQPQCVCVPCNTVFSMLYTSASIQCKHTLRLKIPGSSLIIEFTGWIMNSFINPRRMHRRIIVVVWSVCVSVCLSVLPLIWKSMESVGYGDHF